MANYKLLEPLGKGGMGIVYKALQESTGREVAIKFLTSEAANTPDFVARFKREIAVSLRVEHPNVVKLYDSGDMDGKLYYVMEYLAGAKPLDSIITKEAPMRAERAIDLAIQLCDALGHCHEHGIVHRDVKPPNIMVTANGRAILMDFGLVTDPGATMLTQEGHVVGTPRFLAPELVKGETSSPASDMWALGATIYEMLTGRQAFGGMSMVEMARAIVREEPPPPSTVNTSLPPELDAVIADMIKKNPEERLKDAKLARARFEEVLALGGGGPVPQRRRTAATPRARITGRSSAVTPPAVPTGVFLAQRRAGAAAVVVVLAVACGVFITRQSKPPPLPDVPSATASAAAPPPSVPGYSPAEHAARLTRALDRLNPMKLLRPMVAELSKKHRRKPTPEYAKEYAQILARWQGRIGAAVTLSQIGEAAKGFSAVRDRVFGAGGLAPEEQRVLAERIQELYELKDATHKLGCGDVELPELVSSRYGPIDAPTLASPAGAALILQSGDREFEAEAHPAPTMLRYHINKDDERRMRAVTDPRVTDLEAEFGTPWRLTPEPMCPTALPGAIEVHAEFNNSTPGVGVRVLVAHTRPATDTKWRAIAWLQPLRRDHRHSVYHSLPPGLIDRGPIWMRVEVIYNWPYAILDSMGTQDVYIPWLALAVPR